MRGSEVDGREDREDERIEPGDQKKPSPLVKVPTLIGWNQAAGNIQADEPSLAGAERTQARVGPKSSP